jgi:hypothetical protein
MSCTDAACHPDPMQEMHAHIGHMQQLLVRKAPMQALSAQRGTTHPGSAARYRLGGSIGEGACPYTSGASATDTTTHVDTPHSSLAPWKQACMRKVTEAPFHCIS